MKHLIRKTKLVSQHGLIRLRFLMVSWNICYNATSNQDFMGLLNAEKIAEAVLVHVFRIAFPAPLFMIELKKIASISRLMIRAR